jgi:MATE family multidrug resistance protein
MHRVAPIVWTMLVANLTNAALNWVFVYGHLGSPALGVAGSSIATAISRWLMTVLLLVLAWKELRPALVPRSDSWQWRPIVRMLGIGLPIGAQQGLEVSAFGAIGLLMGVIGTVAMAAHQIAITLAALTFMVPLGVASAAAVRVGQAVGRRDPRGAASAGWTAIAIGVAFMATAAIVFLLVPRALIRLFTTDASVLDLGVSLLFVAAVFQLFDGLQGVTTGALRGLAVTRTAMLWNLTGHWLVGLPLGYLLCFRWGLGVVGPHLQRPSVRHGHARPVSHGRPRKIASRGRVPC